MGEWETCAAVLCACSWPLLGPSTVLRGHAPMSAPEFKYLSFASDYGDARVHLRISV
jgi:hypothetical protein